MVGEYDSQTFNEPRPLKKPVETKDSGDSGMDPAAMTVINPKIRKNLIFLSRASLVRSP